MRASLNRIVSVVVEFDCVHVSLVYARSARIHHANNRSNWRISDIFYIYFFFIHILVGS